MSSEPKPDPAANPQPSNPPAPEPAGAPPAPETAALQAQLAEAQERHLRLYADFENFKKRAAREREDVRRATLEGAVGRFLPVLDNFEMAMAAARLPATTLETLRAGVEMIHGQLRGALAEFGVEEIDAAGKAFDPSIHEAVSQQESAEVPEGQVLQQIRKGYRLRDRLLRPASVVVARPPSA